MTLREFLDELKARFTDTDWKAFDAGYGHLLRSNKYDCSNSVPCCPILCLAHEKNTNIGNVRFDNLYATVIGQKMGLSEADAMIIVEYADQSADFASFCGEINAYISRGNKQGADGVSDVLSILEEESPTYRNIPA